MNDAAYYQRAYKTVACEREWLVRKLRESGAVVIDGVANFVRVLLPEDCAVKASDVAQGCEERHGVFFRVLDDSSIRVAVRLRSENERIVAALKHELPSI